MACIVNIVQCEGLSRCTRWWQLPSSMNRLIATKEEAMWCLAARHVCCGSAAASPIGGSCQDQGDSVSTSFRQDFCIYCVVDACKDLFDAGSSIAVFDLWPATVTLDMVHIFKRISMFKALLLVLLILMQRQWDRCEDILIGRQELFNHFQLHSTRFCHAQLLCLLSKTLRRSRTCP